MEGSIAHTKLSHPPAVVMLVVPLVMVSLP